MNVTLDNKKCKGCGICEMMCPEVFEFKDGCANTKSETVPSEFEGYCLEAVWICPVQAIAVRDMVGGLAPEWSTCSPRERLAWRRLREQT